MAVGGLSLKRGGVLITELDEDCRKGFESALLSDKTAEGISKGNSHEQS
jgi:hypothetical protein